MQKKNRFVGTGLALAFAFSMPSADAAKGGNPKNTPTASPSPSPKPSPSPSPTPTATSGSTTAAPSFQTLWQNNDWAPLGLENRVQGTGSSITVGSTNVVRSAGSRSIRYVYNPSGATTSERVELHSARNFMGMGEGSVVYFGWSDYYVTLPMHKYTIFQWRDQDLMPGSSSSYTGCPVIQLEMADSVWGLGSNINGVVAIVKEGYAPGGKGVVLPAIKAGVWYDTVVAIHFAKDGSGWMKVWSGTPGTLDYAAPDYTYTGPTMYNQADMTPLADGTLPLTTPCSYNGPKNEDHFNSPQLRIGGAYMWSTKSSFESYKGPLRINFGESGESGFKKVLPR